MDNKYITVSAIVISMIVTVNFILAAMWVSNQTYSYQRCVQEPNGVWEINVDRSRCVDPSTNTTIHLGFYTRPDMKK